MRVVSIGRAGLHSSLEKGLLLGGIRSSIFRPLTLGLRSQFLRQQGLWNGTGRYSGLAVNPTLEIVVKVLLDVALSST